jgi:hypothetical protein
MRIKEVTQISSATANSTKLAWLAASRLGCHSPAAQINVSSRPVIVTLALGRSCPWGSRVSARPKIGRQDHFEPLRVIVISGAHIWPSPLQCADSLARALPLQMMSISGPAPRISDKKLASFRN